ncbi:facilitated trehalose transporter Tret1-like [Diaphorina citri]|uniref:Facilitated trehalose transporter Tret1-like n=1 Tax=Diaphorina citri TaxID=121845 RepID=A0A1S3DH34_DIACI|nr:facilitated trehalose transporter Tret1-like [Diaphorina citri]
MAVQMAQQDFIVIQKYFYNNDIYINEKKTEAMIMGVSRGISEINQYPLKCHMIHRKPVQRASEPLCFKSKSGSKNGIESTPNHEQKCDKNGIQASNPYQYDNNNTQGHSNKSAVIRSDKPDSNRNGKWKSALSQALATSAKNMLLFSYGTTLGLPTIAIPYLSYSIKAIPYQTGSINLIMVLTYVAEITQPHLRGMLSATASMTTIFGTVSQLFLGSFLHWRSAAILNLLFPILALCALYFIPESPHWLISQGRMQEASASLCWLRGWVTPDKVQTELSQITKAIEESELKRLGKDGQRRPNYRMYMRRTFLLPYAIVTSLFFIGQFGGMTTLQTYAVGIFESIHAPLDPYFATLLLGVAELGGALLCVVLIHYTGKRPLALISTGGSAACFIVVAVYAQFHLSYGWDSPLVPTVFLVLAAFLTHICIRLLPWMLIGEVFPNNIRATASGASGSSSYIFAFAVNKLYYPMLDTFHLWGTLYFYAAISVVGTLYMYFVMPETEGRTLRDIEEHFADKGKTFVTNIRRAEKKRHAAKVEGQEEVKGEDNFGMEGEDGKYISRF